MISTAAPSITRQPYVFSAMNSAIPPSRPLLRAHVSIVAQFQASERRCHDCHPGDQANSETCDTQAEPAPIVKIDDLEWENGAVAKLVHEDSQLDQPQFSREPVAEVIRQSLPHGLAIPPRQ